MYNTNYTSPLCRIIVVSAEGVLMNSKFKPSTETFDVNETEESDDWN
ncbi:MAG: hypothetical protein J6O51_09890 [Bacteroidales bacterium]|nr:hypothetical protein [Bacteroidales bacterium]